MNIPIVDIDSFTTHPERSRRRRSDPDIANGWAARRPSRPSAPAAGPSQGAALGTVGPHRGGLSSGRVSSGRLRSGRSTPPASRPGWAPAPGGLLAGGNSDPSMPAPAQPAKVGRLDPRAIALAHEEVAAKRDRRGPKNLDRRASASLRLTRRGRLVIVLALLTLALCGYALAGGPAASSSPAALVDGPSRPTAVKTVVVRPGQTLWDIATAAAPRQDPRELIAEIADLNSLSDAGSIRVGQPLIVPLG